MILVPVAQSTSALATIFDVPSRWGLMTRRRPRVVTSIVVPQQSTAPVTTLRPLPMAPRVGRRHAFVERILRSHRLVAAVDPAALVLHTISVGAQLAESHGARAPGLVGGVQGVVDQFLQDQSAQPLDRHPSALRQCVQVAINRPVRTLGRRK